MAVGQVGLADIHFRPRKSSNEVQRTTKKPGSKPDREKGKRKNRAANAVAKKSRRKNR